MTTTGASVEEQMRALMRGVQYGDPHIQATMEAELRERLAEGRPLRVYCGFDPTSTELTLGNLVPMLKLRQFQRFGHEVTFLIGTMTAIVGDPSDKTAARQMLKPEQIEANAATWLGQAFRVLDSQKTLVKRNGDWLGDLTLAALVQLASNFTVQQFLDRETFRQRLEQNKPIYVHELLYALMQGYDAVAMHTDVQLGGTDQLFNIMAGRTLQRAHGQKPQIAVCLPLLIGTDGNLKMSKSTGNYIGLDDPPAAMYGKVMSIPDSLIVSYYTLLTDVPKEEVAAIQRGLTPNHPGNQSEGSHAPAEHPERFNPMEAKKRLAREIVATLNGGAAAAQAQQEFERVFQRREEPEEVTEFPLAFPADVTTADVAMVLVCAGLAKSRSEARRLLTQGAIEVDGVKISDPQPSIHRGSLLKVGRHRFLRFVDAEDKSDV